MSFSRRTLLKASAATAVLGGLGAPHVARAQSAEFTYKYANNLPDTHPMNVRAKEMAAAILTAVTTTGKAIFFTATIVLIGILPWYFLSALKFLADMGLLLVMVMLINMVIALIVVPLLVWLIRPRFIESTKLMVSEGIDLAALAEESRESLRETSAESVQHPNTELAEVAPVRP